MKIVVYSKSALRSLRRIPANEADRIRLKIRQFAQDSSSLANNVKSLKGSVYVRLRVGDWRVIMDDQGRVLMIIAVGPRGDIYE